MANQGTPARTAIFFDRLAEACRRHDSLLCVGLDPPLEGIPDARLVAHNRKIIDATADLACCFKPNIAFYEARGIPGMKALAETMNLVRAKGLPVILDAKRGDISSTAAAYAKAAFERWNADAVTLSPFLGRDSVEPFTAYADRGVFLLCHTSNPGARDLQELETGGMPLYQLIAALASSWNRSGNVGLVVSATYPEEVARVRQAVRDLWFLLPGVGAQGGDLATCLEAGLRPDGLGVVVNVSRAIYQAADPRAAALDYRDRINAIRRAARGAAGGVAAAGATPGAAGGSARTSRSSIPSRSACTPSARCASGSSHSSRGRSPLSTSTCACS